MADRYLLESGGTDGYLLEDGSGVLILEVVVVNYPLTCNSGSYAYTGSSTVINYVAAHPQVISTTTFVLGTSATPGAQSITVPSDAQIVIVTSRNYSASGANLSLSSNFAGTFTTTQDSNGGTERTTVSYAVVSSTGSKTITPVWTNAPTEGPLFFVTFVKNVNTGDFFRASDAIALDAAGSTASRTVSSTANDLVIALESHFDSGGAIPGTSSGWTSISTQGNNSEGGRLNTANSPGASTTTFTGSSTSYNGVAIISLKPNTVGTYVLVANSGSYAYTGSSTTVTRNRALTSSAGSHTYTGSSATITKAAPAVNYPLTATAGSYSGTGSTATILKGRRLVENSGAYSYSGSSATVLRNRALTCSAGARTYTGSSMLVVKGRPVTALAGSYSYSGQTAVILRKRSLTSLTGSYSYTGQTLSVRRNRSLTSSQGAYSYVGQTVTVFRGRPITTQAGSYSYSGQQLPVWRGRALITQLGGYSLTGNSAIVTKGGAAQNYSLTALAGSYAQTGQSAVIRRGRDLVASSGPYSYTGQVATIRRNRSLTALAGNHTYSGQSASITYTPAVGGHSLTMQAGAYGLSGQNTTILRNRAVLLNSGGYAVSGGIAGIFAGAVQRPPGRAISVMVRSRQIASLVTTKAVAVRPSATAIPLFIQSNTTFVRPTDPVIFTK